MNNGSIYPGTPETKWIMDLYMNGPKWIYLFIIPINNIITIIYEYYMPALAGNGK